MIIPVKCFTCGNVIADKYRFYQKEVKKRKMASDMDIDNVLYFGPNSKDKTPEGEVMDLLNLKICCRRHMITHVDIE